MEEGSVLRASPCLSAPLRTSSTSYTGSASPIWYNLLGVKKTLFDFMHDNFPLLLYDLIVFYNIYNVIWHSVVKLWAFLFDRLSLVLINGRIEYRRGPRAKARLHCGRFAVSALWLLTAPNSFKCRIQKRNVPAGAIKVLTWDIRTTSSTVTWVWEEAGLL